ncbi:hypothetical protein DPMN_109576 [Dreissena polymorpha]|uniref:Uncharacterized protein n=1 Tax=Dreissena polymorpha TaxID=45954 RepID=A0A9D4QM39_DREPO|nr:hypothetical protein DPMN_109576 [Dreissena polymorpha]
MLEQKTVLSAFYNNSFGMKEPTPFLETEALLLEKSLLTSALKDGGVRYLNKVRKIHRHTINSCNTSEYHKQVISPVYQIPDFVKSYNVVPYLIQLIHYTQSLN